MYKCTANRIFAFAFKLRWWKDLLLHCYLNFGGNLANLSYDGQNITGTVDGEFYYYILVTYYTKNVARLKPLSVIDFDALI